MYFNSKKCRNINGNCYDYIYCKCESSVKFTVSRFCYQAYFMLYINFSGNILFVIRRNICWILQLAKRLLCDQFSFIAHLHGCKTLSNHVIGCKKFKLKIYFAIFSNCAWYYIEFLQFHNCTIYYYIKK